MLKAGVEPYNDEFIACLGEVAQYIYDTHGRFPSTYTTMVLTGYVQAVHLDSEYYDTHFQPGAYLPAQSRHWEKWHSARDDSPPDGSTGRTARESETLTG